ncbi:MAG: LLM class F420-dependent oxidoreductase [Oscillochloris sp.]|nr:LLM class F420-dependent oxidoreductase [Oscillochloris sp.]
MKIGLQIPNFSWEGGAAVIGPRLAEIAQAADQAGFASFWLMDHLFQIPYYGQLDEAMLECYTTLSYLAGQTRRITLGALVTAATYRYPGLLAKTVTTLDVLSGGRAWLGIGAGWHEREAHGLGLPFPPLGERFSRLEETLQIVRQMWSGQVAPYQGRHYQLAETLNSPPPLHRPHPPILIGGAGEQKTLRMVAQYADACNLFERLGPDGIRQKIAVLHEHCAQIGRPVEEIEITSIGTVHLAPEAQSPADLIARCHALANAGVQHAIFNMPNVASLAPLETFRREIIPAAAEL